MCVISKLAKTERKQQDSSVRRATKRDRMTKVTRIRGPIWTHASALTNAVEAESANHLIARQNQATLCVTSRKIVGLFPEQLWFQFVPVLHRLQGGPAAQG